MSLSLGHFVCVFARPQYTYLPLSADGDIVEPPLSNLPFRPQNFAFAIAKGKSLPDNHIQLLESKEFTSMKYQDRVVWLKEEMNKEMFVELSHEIRWEDTAAVPQRYLNPAAYRTFLSLISITTRVCEFFHRISEVSASRPIIAAGSNEVEGCKLSTDYEKDPDIPAGPDDVSKNPDFTKPSTGTTDSVYRLLGSMIVAAAVAKPTPNTSMVAMNSSRSMYSGFANSGDIEEIKSKGKIFKFEPKLALPDSNLISDILGRRFLSLLGVTRNEQFENLRELKSGIGALRLTEVGDELTHLYKCLDIAIECQSGCIPFFSSHFYEGCVVMGGYGATLSIGEFSSNFEEPDALKNDFLTASTHGLALSSIANKFPGDLREDVLSCTSMKELRDACLPRQFSSDDRDYVIQKALNLRFSQRTWALSPVMLKKSLSIITDLGNLDESCPISRVCLFSNDPVLIGLSVFGEKSAPSWNIPNGALQSVKSSHPPQVPKTDTRGSGSKGVVNDASWVMEVRRTDLLAAVDDFREMARLQSYRSLPSMQARKQGYLIFSRERMGEFWTEMRSAYRQVDPGFIFDELEKSLKRTVDQIEGGISAGVELPLVRKLKF